VPVRACHSWYAATGAGTHFPKIPRWKFIAIPGDLTDQVAIYTDTHQTMQVLGPNGWRCVADVGNGIVGLKIVAPRDKLPGYVPDGGGRQRRSGRTGINVIGYGASEGMWQLVCPYFRVARVNLYKGQPWIKASSCRIPNGERVFTVSGQLKRVDDPPHVAGDNFPSGGADWALGNAFFDSSGGGGSYLMTCTLPSSLNALCYASLARFESQWIRASQPAASATHRARTVVVTVDPWTKAGGLKAGERVARTVRGTCWTDSIAVASSNAYRCMTTHSEIYDPCFSPPRGRISRLACMAVPWGKVTWLVLRAGIRSLRHPSGTPRVWGEELSNGVRCTNAEGAVGRIDGAYLYYYCAPGKGFAGVPIRRGEPWTTRFAPSATAKRLHIENVHMVWL